MVNPAHPLYNIHRKMNHFEVAPRDPVSIATLIAPAVMAAEGVGAFLLTTAVAIGMTAVTTWAVNALTPKPSMGSSSISQGLQTNLREAAAPHEIVYGKVRKGGVITFMEATGTQNKFLHMILVLAGHEVEEIGNIYIDDKVVSINGSGVVTSSPWNSKITIKKYLGSSTQTADPDLVADTSVDSNFRGRGIAYLYIKMEYDPDVFVNGIPLFTAVVKGKKVYDPATGLTQFSDNAALCIRDYLTSSYGVGEASANIDDVAINVAKVACNEDVPLSAGGTEQRFNLNGVLSTADSPRTNLQKMMTTCGGTLFWGQGKWKLKVGVYTSPVKTFTLDNLRGPIQLNTKVSRRDNFNIVKGTFVDSNQDYIVAEYPQFKHTTSITEDNGEENTLDLELPLTVTSSAAKRLAKLTLLRARQQKVITADFDLSAFSVEPGDIVGLTISRYGWTAKEFEVQSWKLLFDPDGGDLRVQLSLRETASSAFGWSAEEESITSNSSNLPDPLAGLTISSLVVTPDGELDDDGKWRAAFRLNWPDVDSAFVDIYRVQWKKQSDTEWESSSTSESNFRIEGLKANVTYDIRVRAISVGGDRGPWKETSSLSNRKIAAPGEPTDFFGLSKPSRVVLNWDNPTDKDLAHIEVWSNDTNSLGSATLYNKIDGEKISVERPSRSEKRWYWIRSVDRSGNKSGYVGPLQVTTRGVQTADADPENFHLQRRATYDKAVNTPPSGSSRKILNVVVPCDPAYQADIEFRTQGNSLGRKINGKMDFSATYIIQFYIGGTKVKEFTCKWGPTDNPPQHINLPFTDPKKRTGDVNYEVRVYTPASGSSEVDFIKNHLRVGLIKR